MINSWHKQRDFSLSSRGFYVGYHAVSSNGIETITREEDEEGAHCNQSEFSGDPRGSMNFHSLGYCLAGDFDRELPDPRDVDNMVKKVKEWQEKYSIPFGKIRPHRFYTNWKTCFGSKLPDYWARNLIEGNTTIDRLNTLQEMINRLRAQIAELMRRRLLGIISEKSCGAAKE